MVECCLAIIYISMALALLVNKGWRRLGNSSLQRGHCMPLQPARIQALPLEQLEALTVTEALLDFSGAADLTAWLK